MTPLPPDSPDSIDDARLVAYFAGASEPAERALVDGWRQRYPDAFADAQAAWELSAGPDTAVAETEQFLGRLRPHLYASDLASSARAGHVIPRPHVTSRAAVPVRRSPWRAAALSVGAVGVAVALAVGVWRNGLTPSHDVAAGNGAGTPVREVRAEPGRFANVSLPDGTTVLLNAGSRITYPADFGKTTRAVAVDGEALFTVSHQSDIPFVVRSGGVTTRVLGTVFSVRRYATDSATRVIVAQGKVMAANTILTTGQMGVSRPDGSVVRDTRPNLTASLAWTTGQLVLDYVPLREAVPDLERWFAIHIELSSRALAEQPIHIDFQTETPRQAMRTLATALRAHATWRGDTVTFSPSHSSAQD